MIIISRSMSSYAGNSKRRVFVRMVLLRGAISTQKPIFRFDFEALPSYGAKGIVRHRSEAFRHRSAANLVLRRRGSEMLCNVLPSGTRSMNASSITMWKLPRIEEGAWRRARYSQLGIIYLGSY